MKESWHPILFFFSNGYKYYYITPLPSARTDRGLMFPIHTTRFTRW